MKVTSVIASIGQPITYYPALAKALESIPAAIFLAQLIYWTGKQADEGGWIYKTQQEWENEIGLSRREQETARRKLTSLNLTSEKLKDLPARLYYKINEDEIEKWFHDKVEWRKAPSTSGGKRHTSMAESAIHTTTETTIHRIPKNTNNGAGEILTYLNTKAGRNYQKVNAHTTARLKEYTKEDLMAVIDWKTLEWANGDMAKFLRQETLFAPSHFDTYLDDARRNLAGVEKKAYDKYCDEFYQAHMSLPLEERRGKRPLAIEEWRKENGKVLGALGNK